MTRYNDPTVTYDQTDATYDFGVAAPGMFIGGEKYPIKKDSLQVTDVIEGRSTCKVVVVDLEGGLILSRGDPVHIRLGAEAQYEVFDGVVFDTDILKIAPGQPYRYISLTCVDWHYYADKRRVAESYLNITAGAVVLDLLNKYLALEGIRLGTIEDGPAIAEVVLNYPTAAEAISQMAQQAGFWWNIDQDMKLHFRSREAVSAPWSLTYADILKDSIGLPNSNPSYRNRQYIRGGMDLTEPQTEAQHGDGEKRSFTTSYPIGKVPTITVNGVAQTVGIRGVDEDRAFYWSKGEAIVSQDSNLDPLSASDVLEVVYQGLFPIIALAQDFHQIQQRADAERGTGYVDDIQDNLKLSSREAALQEAAGYLGKYASMGRKLKFRTERYGLKPGQLLSANLPHHGLEADLLVVQVETSGPFYDPVFSIEAVEGPYQGSWHSMFAAMAKSQVGDLVDRVNVGSAGTLLVLHETDELWHWAETVVQSVYACPVPSTSLFPSASLYPC